MVHIQAMRELPPLGIQMDGKKKTHIRPANETVYWDKYRPEDMWSMSGDTRKRDKRKEYMISEREEKVLEMRYGLKDGVTHTLNETGIAFNVTGTRIRQIEHKAMEEITGVVFCGIGQGNVSHKEVAQLVKEVYEEYKKTKKK
jgi:hypothetical protein